MPTSPDGDVDEADGKAGRLGIDRAGLGTRQQGVHQRGLDQPRPAQDEFDRHIDARMHDADMALLKHQGRHVLAAFHAQYFHDPALQGGIQASLHFLAREDDIGLGILKQARIEETRQDAGLLPRDIAQQAQCFGRCRGQEFRPLAGDDLFGGRQRQYSQVLMRL